MSTLSAQARIAFAAIDGCRIVELVESDIAVVQQFYDANPQYSQTVFSRPPRPGDAHDDFYDRPPAEFPQGVKRLLGFAAADDELLGVAEIVTDLFANSVWHIGLFIVATNQHGNGLAGRLYQAIEAEMHARGACWLRLGVVKGNLRGERFWLRCGFSQVRLRDNVSIGEMQHSLHVMMKPLSGGSVTEYLALVERDRPPDNALG